MKIAICGKGGCGKSTVTTLLSQNFVKKGKEVLIIDSDESNYGLHRHLGMENPKDFIGFLGGKENVLGDMMASNFSHQFFKEAWRIKDIPKGYYTEKDGIKLMVSGKIAQANEGCSCAMGTVIKQFVMHLNLEENQIAILDMEAGIEHFGRGIDDEADIILMVCDPSYESLQLAKKIGKLCENIQKPVYYILNKVQENNEKIICDAIENKEHILAVLPMMPELMEASLRGEKLKTSLAEVDKISDKITAYYKTISV